MAAQDDAAVTQAQADAGADPAEATPPEGAAAATPQAPQSSANLQILNLSVTVPQSESDRLIERDCDDANEAGQIANEIVVCRQLGTSSTDGAWNKAEWERRYAEKTKGGSTPNTFGIPNHGNPIGLGSAPPPAYIVDFEALPEAPAGSDADRIARGLPPLGRDAELSEEAEKARRAALGGAAPAALAAPE